MKSWPQLLRKPKSFEPVAVQQWFSKIAERLLNATDFVIAGVPHEILEVEFYYRGAEHEDPFAHGDPVQRFPDRWYFHRTGGVYRGGSFKGLDLTFGNRTARAGILIRSLRLPDGEVLSGPSLLVDRLLALCRNGSVAELDRELSERLAWNAESLVHLAAAKDRRKPILACARVGLTLLKAKPGSTRPAFLTRPYRFLTEPARIPKGKAHMVMALHRKGESPEAIRDRVGTPLRTIQVYVSEYEAGRRGGSFEEFFGKEIGPKDLCRLHGMADRLLAM
jgi:hypothetical protein